MMTLYGQFVEEMERSGLRKVFTILEEKDVGLSDNDDTIIVSAKDCQAISIKGIRESMVNGKLLTHPYYISMKIYGDDGNEILPGDTVRFGIGKLKKSGLPTLTPDTWFHIVYYHYPYRLVSSKLKLKKGIVITKDKRLEIKIERKGELLKIAKLDIRIECDKWYKKDMV